MILKLILKKWGVSMLVNLIITDNDNNFYGILKVNSNWNSLAVNNLFRTIIKEEFGTDEKFFEDFSGNLSIAIEKLEKTILKDKVQAFNNGYSVIFEYENYEYFNVDDIFDSEEEYIKSLNLSKEDLFVVAQCFADMIANNVDYKDDNIGESFYNWCEGGNTFYNMYGNWATEHLTENEKIEAQRRTKLMKVFCKYADNVTDFFLRVYNLL